MLQVIAAYCTRIAVMGLSAWCRCMRTSADMALAVLRLLSTFVAKLHEGFCVELRFDVHAVAPRIKSEDESINPSSSSCSSCCHASQPEALAGSSGMLSSAHDVAETRAVEDVATRVYACPKVRIRLFDSHPCLMCLMGCRAHGRGRQSAHASAACMYMDGFARSAARTLHRWQHCTSCGSPHNWLSI